jgi:polyisoprenoid-binding protein YceI
MSTIQDRPAKRTAGAITTMLVMASLCIAGGATHAQSTYKVDASSTRMIWTGRQLTGAHQGNVKVSGGTVTWGTEGLLGAEVTVDMTSITNTDLGKEYGPRLVKHLKSEDFFNTAVHKTATFKTTRVEKIPGVEPGQANYNVTGDLTIKGITKPVTFKVLAWQEKNRVRAAGTLAFNRTLYDITFRSGSFFQSLGDKMIEDMVELTFDLTGK